MVLFHCLKLFDLLRRHHLIEIPHHLLEELLLHFMITLCDLIEFRFLLICQVKSGQRVFLLTGFPGLFRPPLPKTRL